MNKKIIQNNIVSVKSGFNFMITALRVFVSITIFLIILNDSALGTIAVTNTAASQTYGNLGETSALASYLVSFDIGNNLETNTTRDKNFQITISDPTDGQVSFTSSITVKGTVSGKIHPDFVEVMVGSESWIPATGTTSWTVSSVNLMEGSNTITARATDTSGNSDETSVTVTYTPPDKQNPVILITSHTNDQILSNSTITVSGTASDNEAVSKVEVKIGSDPWQLATGTTSWTVSSIPLIAGSNTITAKATDTSGNSDETSVTVIYTPPDKQNPVILITSHTNDQILSTSTITVSGTASDNEAVSKVEVKIGSDPWQLATGTTSWTVSSIPLMAGSNTFLARANDTSGNSNETSITLTYTPPDNQYPVIFITSHTNDQILSVSPITVSGNASDNEALRIVEVKIGSDPWQTATGTTYWTVSSVNLLEGSNMITARANDSSGNSIETSIMVIYNPGIEVHLDINSATNTTKTTVNEKSASGNAFLTIPKGTMAKDVAGNLLESINIITITNLPVDVKISENDRLIGELVGLEPEGAYFDPPIQIGFYYTEPLPGGINEESLSVRFFDTSTNSWESLPIIYVNKTQNYLIANISHFSLYTLIGTAATSSGGGNINRETSSSSGGGGGGGGGSGEKYSNIDVNEKYDLSIYKDRMTSYRFTSPKNPIVGVDIIGNANSDLITTIVESLKNTSTLVTLAAPGIVYRNANIWVGTSGFASPKRIKEAFIKFRVDNNWMSANSVTGNDIILMKWNGNGWMQLETRVLSNDGANTFFEGKTNAFSSFAITTKMAGVKPTAMVSDNEIPSNVVETTPDEILPKVVETANISKIAIPVSSKWSIILILFIINIIIIAVYFKYIKN